MLKNPCRFKDLPRNQRLTKPGKQQTTSSLDEDERKLNEELNKAGHIFRLEPTNRSGWEKIQNYGWIWCHNQMPTLLAME